MFKKILILLVAVLVAMGIWAGVSNAAGMGAAPREVDLNVPCQTENQLNCTWYGESIPPRQSENPPVYTSTYWFNYAEPDGETFCRYRLVPVRQLTCATHWPLTLQDEFPGATASKKARHHHRHHHHAR